MREQRRNPVSSRLQLNISEGLLEVEGSEEFVLRIYEDAKAFGLLKSTAVTLESSEDSLVVPSKIKARKSSAKRGGPSCAERIIALIQSGFFDITKSANEVKVGLEQNG